VQGPLNLDAQNNLTLKYDSSLGLDVSGNLKLNLTAATNLLGVGTSITALNATNITSGTLSTTYGGTGVTTGLTVLNPANLSSAVTVDKGGTGATTLTSGQLLIGNGTTAVLQSANLAWNNTTNTLSATNISGSGTGLTALNATNITSGTLSTTYGGTGVTTGLTVLNPANLSSAVTVAKGGTGATTLTSGQLLIGNGTTAVLQSANLAWNNTTNTLSATNISGSGTGLTALNATNITSGTLSTTYGGTGVTTGLTVLNPANLSSAVTVAKGGTGATTLTSGQLLIGNGTTAVLQSANLAWNNTTNTLSATNIVGNGSGITGITGASLTGIDYNNLSNKLTFTSPLSINASNAVSIDLSAKQNTLTAATNLLGIGTSITALNATNITSGTLSTTYGGTGVTTGLTVLNPANLSSAVTVDKGGTGATTLTSGQLLIGNGTTAVLQSANLAWNNTTNTLSATNISGSGTGLTALNATNITSGTLSTTYGGTGVSTSNTINNYLFNNTGANHGDNNDFNAITTAGYKFIVGNVNSPSTAYSQYYSWLIGLGINYPVSGTGSYSCQFALPRNTTNPPLSVRYKENNSWTAWTGITASYADNLTSGNKSINGNLSCGGNVLINTTSDYSTNTKLFIQGSSFGYSQPLVRIQQNAGWDGNYALQVVGYSDFGGIRINGADTGNTIYTTGNNNMGFTTNLGNMLFNLNNSERMRIDTAGNVGIGKSPSYKLDVNGDTKVTGYLYNDGNISLQGTIYMTNNRAVTNYWQMYINSSNSNFTFNHYNPGSSINSNWWFNGTQTNTQSEISDNRVKKEIKEIDNPLDKLMLLKPKEYKLCQDKDYNKKFGLIAQDIYETDLNEFVVNNEEEYVANIFAKGTYNNQLIISDKTINNINIDDEIKLVFSNDGENKEYIIDGNDGPFENRYKRRYVKVKSIIDDYTFEISDELDIKEESFLIYGKKVNDFHKLDYHSMYALNIAATQELFKIVQDLKTRI